MRLDVAASDEAARGHRRRSRRAEKCGGAGREGDALEALGGGGISDNPLGRAVLRLNGM